MGRNVSDLTFLAPVFQLGVLNPPYLLELFDLAFNLHGDLGKSCYTGENCDKQKKRADPFRRVMAVAEHTFSCSNCFAPSFLI